MSLHFHWFLPTNGDGRNIVGGGRSVTTGSAGVGLLRGGAGTALVGRRYHVPVRARADQDRSQMPCESR